MLVAPNYLAFYLPKPYHYSLRIQILLNSNLPTIVHGHFGSILPLHNPRCGPIDPFAFVMQKSLIVTLGIQNSICSRSKMQHNGDDMGLCEIIIHSHNQVPTPERSAPFHATSFLWAKIPVLLLKGYQNSAIFRGTLEKMSHPKKTGFTHILDE